MKSTNELVSILEEKKSYLCAKYNVKTISVFGSYSRSEETPQSDVDVLVEFEKPVGLEFVDLAEELEDILGLKVDLVSKKGVKEKYLKEIEQDLVHV